MNLLITGAWSEAKENMKVLREKGHTVYFMQYETDELPCEYSWVEGVICNGLFLVHPIELFPNLRYIQLTSAGFDRVPVEIVSKRGIELKNAHGVYSIPMAEFAVGGVLQLYKQARFFGENQAVHAWKKHRGLGELFGKTVCVVGCGNVGTECAKRFYAFGCNVLGVDLLPREDAYYQKMVDIDELESILPQADVLVLTLPLTEKTKHLMNTKRIRMLKKGAVLVNIARGAVVDTEALINAGAHLGGAVLDVFEEEPLNEGSPLWNMENVLVTPHNSFVGEHNQERLKQVIFKNLEGR